jgi:hypothetical protein
MTTSGTGTSGSGSRVTVTSLQYDDTPTPSYTAASLLVAVAPDGTDASADRADAQTTWVPQRASTTLVPAGADHADLLAFNFSPSHSVAHATINGSAVAKLTRIINGLPEDNRGTHGCTFDSGFRMSATFSTAQGPLLFTEVAACSSVGVALDGQREPGLLDSPSLQQLLRNDLHLSNGTG